jgi:hypothetical protein
MFTRRRPPSRTHKILHHDRRRALAHTDTIATALRDAAASGATNVHISGSVHQLRSVIQSLEHQVIAEGDGSSPTVTALKNIDLSLAELIKANTAGDPEQAMSALVAGLEAFDKASRAARKAGHDWAL